MIFITGKQLAYKIAKDNEIDKKFCDEFVKELFKVVSEELKNGESVTIKGFGRFIPIKKPDREYHTPDGKTGICPAKTVVKWEMGEKFKSFLLGEITEI